MRNQIYVPPGVHVLPVSPLASDGLSGFQITGSAGPAVTLEWRASGTDPWTALTLPVTLAPGELRLTRTDTDSTYACLNGVYTDADGAPPGAGPTWATLTEYGRADQGDDSTIVSFQIPTEVGSGWYTSGLRAQTAGSPIALTAYPGTPASPGLIAVGQWASTTASVGQSSGYAYIVRLSNADLATVTAFQAELTPDV